MGRFASRCVDSCARADFGAKQSLEMIPMPEAALATTRQPAWASEAGVSEGLFVLLYAELRRMAQRELRRNAATTLSPTTLLHETFLNVSQRESTAFGTSGQFLCYASCAMRGLIVNYLRNRSAQKRGGEFVITSLPAELPHAPQDDGDLPQVEALNEALQVLARIDVQLAECVDLKFFCGFTFEEIADMRNVSKRTVQRDWDKARILLHRLMQDSPDFRLTAA